MAKYPMISAQPTNNPKSVIRNSANSVSNDRFGINRLQTEEHKSAYTAVIEATVSRVRPVLMASLTTIVGMIPLLGDPMYGSMAITIMGGLTIGTIITLLLLPLFYSALFKIKADE